MDGTFDSVHGTFILDVATILAVHGTLNGVKFSVARKNVVGIFASVAYNGVMRSVSLLAFVVVGAGSHASFDLVFVADNTNSFTGPVPARIHRYDGDTGVYLGAFNAGYAAIRDMAVNQQANELYATTGSLVMVFDYNTGSFKRQFNVTANTIKFHNGRLYGASGSLIRELNVSTGGLTTFHAAANTITDFVFAKNGSFATYAGSTGVLQGVSSSGALGTSVTGLNATFATSTVSLAVDGFGTDRFMMMAREVNTTTSTTQTVFRATSVSAAGTLTNLSSGFFFSSYSNNFIHVEQAHNGNWMYGKNNSGQNSLYRLHTAAGSGDTNFLTPQVSQPGAIAVVLAPEPGTMIALGAGALAVLRRRKKPVNR